MKKNKNFAVASLLALVLALTLMVFASCGTGDNGEEAERGDGEGIENGTASLTLSEIVKENTTVATLNGRAILAGDISYRIEEAKFLLEQGLGVYEDWERAVLEEAVRLASMHIMILDYAEQLGISLTQDEIEGINNHMDELLLFHGEEGFNEMLLANRIYTEEQAEMILRTFTLVDKLIEEIIGDPVLFAPFEQYMEEEEEEELLAAKHILITLDEFESEEAAMLFAQGIWQRVIAGEDFDELIATYGQDPGMIDNPEGYTFVAGVMVPEFENVTRMLEPGEISGPVSAFHGIHIIQRVEPNPDDVMRPWGVMTLTPEQRRAQAVFMAFEFKADNVEIVFMPVLGNISLK